MCGKSFTQKFLLNEHMENHTGDRPCNVKWWYLYKKYFTQIYTDRTWEVSHWGSSQQLWCVYKIFAHKFILTEHMMVHTGERPYNSDVCENILHRHVY